VGARSRETRSWQAKGLAISEYDELLPDTNLGPVRKGEPIPDLPNLSDEENARLKATMVRGSQIGGPKIPDAPDISDAPPGGGDSQATDAEFFVGNRYRPHGRKSRTGATFEIVQHAKETQHVLFEQSRKLQCESRGIAVPPPTFYVQSPRGTIGWVPWIGSVVAWPWEAAWEADLVEKGEPDPKPSEQKKR